MIRKSYEIKYEKVVREALQELFDACRQNALEGGDLLLCQQNASVDESGRLHIGPGKLGINCMQATNAILCKEIGSTTSDDDYFQKEGRSFFTGGSDFEVSVSAELNKYREIWENAYFLRILAQVIHVLNAEPYDWKLEMDKLTSNGKNKFIRENIIQKADRAPKFKKVVEYAYNRNVRNAIAHSQYHLVQGGIFLDNYGSDKYADLRGMSFEEWEKRFVYSYFVFIGIFRVLKDFVRKCYLPMTMITLSGGIPIRYPVDNQTAGMTIVYPDNTGEVWRFIKYDSLH